MGNPNDNGKGKLLLNGTSIVDTLLEKVQEVLTTVGRIEGTIEAMKSKNEIQNRSLKREIGEVKKKLEKHLKEHADNPFAIALWPFLKKNWKVVASLLAALLLTPTAGFGLKEALFKIMGW